VGYRDPVGVISPDGAWLAYSVQHHVYLQRIEGGVVTELPRGTGVVVHLAWTPNAQRVVMDRRGETPRWWRYDVATGEYAPLWPAGFTVWSGDRSVGADDLRQLAFGAGGRVAGAIARERGSELWSFGPNGDEAQVVMSEHALSFPAFAPDGRIGCLLFDGARQTISLPCGEVPAAQDAPEAYGGLAFSPDGATRYTATPNSSGTVDLWARSTVNGRARQLTHFTRDTYAPSVARDGRVLFKVQTYRTLVADLPAEGEGAGPLRRLTAFQSETPFYDPSGQWIGITYGTWRRVIDDFRYPDIAQDAGIVPADPAAPVDGVSRVVDASVSEDQSLAWSPNGRWIAYHSHKEQGDDIWLAPADGSSPGRRITSFGRGFETGWPRWSPDGRWVGFDADARAPGPRRSLIWVVGVDQETGEVTAPETPVALQGFEGDAIHAEWLGSERLVVQGYEAPDRHVLMEVARGGGRTRVIHRFVSEHRYSGFAVSPDRSWIAFPAPADGVFQLFRVSVAGGTPEQLTFGLGNKTQPAYAPDGRRLALTVWEYEVQFWLMRP
jgi:Tol biopolymer transport system component